MKKHIFSLIVPLTLFFSGCANVNEVVMEKVFIDQAAESYAESSELEQVLSLARGTVTSGDKVSTFEVQMDKILNGELSLRQVSFDSVIDGTTLRCVDGNSILTVKCAGMSIQDDMADDSKRFAEEFFSDVDTVFLQYDDTTDGDVCAYVWKLDNSSDVITSEYAREHMYNLVASELGYADLI